MLNGVKKLQNTFVKSMAAGTYSMELLYTTVKKHGLKGTGKRKYEFK
jgi:hypothetical protein